MGQAFDREGNVLGGEFGETKREVFDKLTERFPDAHELRIKSLEAEAARTLTAETEMPRYKCHKEVHALKIVGVQLDSADARAENRETDGYTSFSPAAAFEGGYTRISR
jgi:hypothetical protein